ALQSFPTRRSSDLPGSGWPCACTAFLQTSVLERILHCKTSRRPCRVTGCRRPLNYTPELSITRVKVNRSLDAPTKVLHEAYSRSRHEPVFHARDHPPGSDRKSTRLNSSHVKIAYAVFCLKKKTHPHHAA